MNDTIKLADTSMILWSQLHKAEEDAELGQGGSEMMDLPSVPNQKFGVSGRSEGKQALNQIGELLAEVVDDPQTLHEMSPEDLKRVQEVNRWLSHSPDSDIQKAEDVSLSVKAVLRIDDFVLLLKDAYSEWWDLPGGHVQDGETLQDALKRELWEETGIEVKHMEELMVMVMTLGTETKPVVFFQVEPVQPISGRLSEEHTDFAWVHVRDTEHYNLGQFQKVFSGGGHLIPGGGEIAALRPSHEVAGGQVSMDLEPEEIEEQKVFIPISNDCRKNWDGYSHDINNVDELRPGHVDEQGGQHDDTSISKLKDSHNELQAAASQNAVTQTVVYRGETADTPEEIRVKYPRHAWMLTDKLTSTAVTEEPALAFTAEGGPIKMIIRYTNPHGVKGMPTGGEVILPRGDRYRVTRTFQREDGVYIVDLYSTEKHGLPTSDGSHHVYKSVGYGDDLTNPSFEASLDSRIDPNVDPRQAAVSAIQYQHEDPVEIETEKPDGDIIVACPRHNKRWYITRDGEVFTDGLKA